MKRKNQEGAIIVEATISLTAFMFLIVTILGIVNICLVQAKMSTLIHGIAKDISNYSYIYTMTGANAKEKEINSQAATATKSVDDVLKHSGDLYGTLEEIGNIKFDKDFWNSCVAMLEQAAISGIKGGILNEICQGSLEKRLVDSGEDANAYLVQMGIEEGVEGISFLESQFCYGGGDDIIIVARYKVHVLKLFNIDFDFTFRQCAYTKAWCAIAPSTNTTKSTSDTGNQTTTEEGDATQSATTEPGKETGVVDSTDTATTETEATTEVKKEKTVDEYVDAATQNASSDQVMLGKNSLDPETNYVVQAEKYNMTYFQLDNEDWDALSAQGQDAVWEVNKAFLEEQMDQGKTFYTSCDPYYATGYFEREVDWLMNQGYTFEYDASQCLWRAVKK